MERKMWQFILGSTGFILYFIYDINSVRMKNAVLQKFFAAGSILVVVSLIAELYAAWGSCQRKIGTMTGFGLGGFLFLCLLIYTLFFALPFEETYCEENKLRAAYTEGMYFLLMIFWNYLYIIFQDLWTFPRTFFNYKEYQQSTPFLIPNRKSIRVCLRTIRKND